MAILLFVLIQMVVALTTGFFGATFSAAANAATNGRGIAGRSQEHVRVAHIDGSQLRGLGGAAILCLSLLGYDRLANQGPGIVPNILTRTEQKATT